MRRGGVTLYGEAVRCNTGKKMVWKRRLLSEVVRVCDLGNTEIFSHQSLEIETIRDQWDAASQANSSHFSCCLLTGSSRLDEPGVQLYLPFEISSKWNIRIKSN